MSEFVLSLEAEEDLQEIFLYSETQWGSEQAIKYIHELYDVFDLIATNPQMGRIRKELGSDIQSFSHSSHIVFFFASQSHVGIARILHSSRDFENQF